MADMSDRLKDYVQVNERIEKFYEKYPNGGIRTKLLELNDTKVVIQAYIYRDMAKIVRNPITGEAEADATGLAEEMRDDGYINKTSAVENGETSAVGRAIALLGFEVKKSIASKDEVENAMNRQEAIAKPMTAAQEQAIYTSLRVLELTLKDYEKAIGRTVEGMTQGEASDYIGKLKAKIAKKQLENQHKEGVDSELALA